MVVKVLIQWRLKRPCTWQAIGACYVRETGRTVVVFASWDDGFLMTPSHDLLVNAMVILSDGLHDWLMLMVYIPSWLDVG